jgi:mycothiol system anti-sigma-R factor
VTCDLARSVLHGYLDGELDAARAAEFETHLERCPQCVTELEAQESLRSSLQKARLYERAPARLRQKVLADIHVTARAPRPSTLPSWQRSWQPAWRWLAVAACFLLMMYAGWRWLPGFGGRNQNATLAAQLVDDHIRSLQPGHLSDVVSTDQHTVKPWFDGKLDFAPPVRDFAEQGFPLQGGRLDVLNGRSIAALVYGRRKHEINVFVWPRAATSKELESGSQQGYNWVRWNNGSFEMWAISDVSPGDLDQLRLMFQGQ